MHNDYFTEIKTKSVKYYENNYMSPEFKEQATNDSVIDYASYFYAYSLKLIQNFYRKRKDEASGDLYQLINKQDAAISVDLKTLVLSDFNQFYMLFLEKFKNGLDFGEESIEGFKLMLDASTKIVAMSIYWLEK